MFKIRDIKSLIKTSLVIEIGDKYLKAALIKSYPGKGSQISDFLVEPIESFTAEHISATIVSAMRRLRYKSKNPILCLPRNLCTLRNLHLPSKNQDEIAQMITLHIGRIVPYKKEEIIFSYLFLGIDEIGYSKEIVAIVHSDTIRRQVRIMEGAGLYVDCILLSTSGAWRYIRDARASEINGKDIYLLLDVDSNFTDFIIFNSQTPLFARTIGVEIKERIQETEMARLIGEVKQSLVIFQNEEVNRKPVKVFISGAGAAAKMALQMKDSLDIPVEYVANHPVEAIIRAKKRSLPDNVSLCPVSSMVSRDDAQEISFCLPEMNIKKTLREHTKQLVILGTLLVYLLSMVAAGILGRMHNNQRYLKKITSQNKAIEMEAGNLIVKSRRSDAVSKFLLSRKMTLATLLELHKVTPAEITITHISLDDQGAISLRGQSAQLSDVFKFITILENSNHFKDIATKYTRAKKVKEREMTDFEIALKFVIRKTPAKPSKAVKGAK